MAASCATCTHRCYVSEVQENVCEWDGEVVSMDGSCDRWAPVSDADQEGEE